MSLLEMAEDGLSAYFAPSLGCPCHLLPLPFSITVFIWRVGVDLMCGTLGICAWGLKLQCQPCLLVNPCLVFWVSCAPKPLLGKVKGHFPGMQWAAVSTAADVPADGGGVGGMN
jgi:hypothetical protein